MSPIDNDTCRDKGFDTRSEISAQPAWHMQAPATALFGCLWGGTVGDALGAPVKFMKRTALLHRFGPVGITHYTPRLQWRWDDY